MNIRFQEVLRSLAIAASSNCSYYFDLISSLAAQRGNRGWKESNDFRFLPPNSLAKFGCSRVSLHDLYTRFACGTKCPLRLRTSFPNQTPEGARTDGRPGLHSIWTYNPAHPHHRQTVSFFPPPLLWFPIQTPPKLFSFIMAGAHAQTPAQKANSARIVALNKTNSTYFAFAVCGVVAVFAIFHFARLYANHHHQRAKGKVTVALAAPFRYVVSFFRSWFVMREW